MEFAFSSDERLIQRDGSVVCAKVRERQELEGSILHRCKADSLHMGAHPKRCNVNHRIQGNNVSR